MKNILLTSLLLGCWFLSAIAQESGVSIVWKDKNGEITTNESKATLVYEINQNPHENGFYEAFVYSIISENRAAAETSFHQVGFVTSPTTAIRTGHWEQRSGATLREEGNYLDGLKDGEWTTYQFPGIVRDQGAYRQGEKQGEWVYYHRGGDLSGRVTYDAGEVTTFQYFNSDGTPNLDEKSANRQPEFPGGEVALYTFIAQNANYPSNARRLGQEGRVYVEFVVRPDGSVSDIKVAKGVAPELDTEALRVVKSMPKWTGGRDQNRPVPLKMVVPITFQLEGGGKETSTNNMSYVLYALALAVGVIVLLIVQT